MPPPYGAPPGGAWPPGQPGQPVAAAPGNGVATAAMIVGIISVVLCFAFVGGVAAVVLGVIGLGKAKQLGGRKKGQAIAGLVLGVLSIAIGIGFWVVVRRGVDTVADNLNELGGEADRSTYKVTVETCELDEFGSATAAGTITNTTNKSKNFQVEVEFVRGGKVLDSGSALVDGIEPDQSQDWSVQGSIDGGQAVRCTVTGVFNRLN